MPHTNIMGILNVTPDSFYEGSRYNAVGTAVEQAKQMVADGADMIDIGGESTRPGADPVSVDEEIDRVVPVIEALETPVPISVDTRKPEVAEAALDAGADIVNDVTGLEDDAMKELVADRGCRAVIMDSVAAPVEPDNTIETEDIVKTVVERLESHVDSAKEYGVDDEQIIVDPGIGFGKGKDGDKELIARADELLPIGYPVLIGASRKSFLGDITGLPTEERLEASIAAHVITAWNGADMIRTHDVKETRRALDVADTLKRFQ